MGNRLNHVRDQFENLIKQQDAAKLEIGKPFPQEQELKDKISRLAVLDTELNMGIEVSDSKKRGRKKRRINLNAHLY